MSDLILAQNCIPAMSDESVAKVRALESEAMQQPQVQIETIHTLHAGTYARTIMIPAGVMITGALIKIPTTLIVSGECMVFIGGDTIKLVGYNVLPASANRKQAFLAVTDTWLTMMFKTAATTVEDAEHEFTDECDLL
ncbi:MAG: hypothetical protein ACRCWC_13690, partial [Plesiomonas shigelloides]